MNLLFLRSRVLFCNKIQNSILVITANKLKKNNTNTIT